MARFFAVTLLLSLACASLALPHYHDQQDAEQPQESMPLVMIPGETAGESKFFFFPFNFWNGFKPLPWIPLPGINLPTTAAPGGGDENGNEDAGGEDADEGDAEEDGEDAEEGDDAGDDEDAGDDAGDDEDAE